MDTPPKPSDLLAELTRLHDLLSAADSDANAIPLLQDVVESTPAIQQPDSSHLRPLLMQSAGPLLQDVIRDFTPQITAELEKRLHRHLERLIREQEQQQHQPANTNDSARLP